MKGFSGLSRTRSNLYTRRNSTASSGLRAYLDENDTEIFSGAGLETVPSAIAAFHHAHTFENDENEEVLSTESVPDDASTDSARPTFKFFTPDEIEHAPVASTVDDPLVDYDTDWDLEDGNQEQDQRREQDQNQVVPADMHSESLESVTAPLFRTDTASSTASEEEPSAAQRAALRDAYPCAATHYQRFYIAEEDLVVGIAGYRTSKARRALYHTLCVFTLGVAWVVLRWMPRARVGLQGRKAPLGAADWVVVENEHGELQIQKVEHRRFGRAADTVFNFRDGAKSPEMPVLASFEYRYLRLVYHPAEDIFSTNTNWVDRHWALVSALRKGLDEYAVLQRREIFGRNSLDLKEKLIGALLVQEVLHPFYVFQLLSIFLWLLDDYFYYAACIFAVSLASVAQSLMETRETAHRLRALSKAQTAPTVRVRRSGFWTQIPLEELVPGDLYELSDPRLLAIPCDSVLVAGDCIVNELMLTGESVPVSKVPALDDVLRRHLAGFDLPFVQKNHVSSALARLYLFLGTKTVRVRRSADGPALAVVVKTGFATTKGRLLRLMLFPKPAGLRLYRDSFRYIGVMAAVAGLGFMYSVRNFVRLGLETRVIVLRALDIITIVVPPALPATLTIGTNFAVSRLKRARIFCTSPSKVNVGGKVDVFCFDKTGTLTEDGLDILGVHIARDSEERNIVEFTPMMRSVTGVLDTASGSLNTKEEDGDPRVRATRDKNAKRAERFLRSMCTCHALRIVAGERVGDPLDEKMFEFTGWNLAEDYDTGDAVLPLAAYSENNLIAILRTLEFVPHLRRMSVVAQDKASKRVYTKGAPEVIAGLCRQETLPANYEELLYRYTHDGYRVIAVAYRDIELVTGGRETLEKDLTFLGFIVFENRLKSRTKDTLKALSDAHIRTVMCTGDNILTATSVARESGLVPGHVRVFVPHIDDVGDVVWEDVDDPELVLDPVTLQPYKLLGEKYRLAMTGDVFRHVLKAEGDSFSEAYVERVLLYTDIFARMSPDEKHELVEQLQKLDYVVGFCGDGANDCGALKAADVGVALSEAEALVAAPFTSAEFEIACVLQVIREGRASLVTSFACFRYMSLYLAIQFVLVLLLYRKGLNLGDFQFLWIDMFLILPLAIFMLWSRPYTKIVKKKPSANLVLAKVLVPMLGSVVVLAFFQVFLVFLVSREPWYAPPVPGGDDAVQSSDNTVLFLFSNLQYISIAIILTQGPPYREPSVKNGPFVTDVVISTLFSWALMLASPDGFVGRLMQLTSLSGGFKLAIVALSIANLAALWVGDRHVFPVMSKLFNRVVYGRNRKSKKHFKRLLRHYGETGEV